MPLIFADGFHGPEHDPNWENFVPGDGGPRWTLVDTDVVIEYGAVSLTVPLPIPPEGMNEINTIVRHLAGWALREKLDRPEPQP